MWYIVRIISINSQYLLHTEGYLEKYLLLYIRHLLLIFVLHSFIFHIVVVICYFFRLIKKKILLSSSVLIYSYHITNKQITKQTKQNIINVSFVYLKTITNNACMGTLHVCLSYCFESEHFKIQSNNVEKQTKSIHIYNPSLSWLGTGTSI